MSQEFLHQPVVQQLGWTLLHFAWQATIIAIGFALLQWGLHTRLARLRYLSGCGALLAMLAAPVVTFNVLAEQPAPVIRPATTLARPASSRTAQNPTSSGLPTAFSLTQNARTTVNDWASQHLERTFPWLVSVWLLGVVLFSLRLLIGSWEAFRLGRCGNEPMGEPYLRRVDELRHALAISRPVRLVKSVLVEVPTVIGSLRPVILLPVSALTGLTPAQLESILAHELAHIRRHDYLINLLQNVVETLLFYHPAVWWISHRIRIEREHCCDDMAVTLCGNRLGYAKALATLEHLRNAPGQFALAASGGSLLMRIRRLYGLPTSIARSPWRRAGGVLVMASSVILGLAISLQSGAISHLPTKIGESGFNSERQHRARPAAPISAENHAAASEQLRPEKEDLLRLRELRPAGYTIKSQVETAAGTHRYTWTVHNEDQSSGLDVFVIEVPVETRVLAHTVPPPYSNPDGSAYWLMKEGYEAQVDPNDGKTWLPGSRAGRKWLIWVGTHPPSVYPAGTTATFSLTTDSAVKPGAVLGVATTYTPQNAPHYYLPLNGDVTGPATLITDERASSVMSGNSETTQSHFYNVFSTNLFGDVANITKEEL